MAGIDRTRRITFEEQADLYDATATGYSAEVIDSVVQLAHLPPTARILEIGCGSGQATLPLAERGFTVVAVELGERLAQLAAHKVRDYPRAHIVRHEFESWQLPPERFDLVVSAEAFHWIVPEVGIPKIAQALVPGGRVALLWTVQKRLDTPLHQAIAAIYAEIAPDWQNPLNTEVDADFIQGAVSRWFTQAGGFEPLTAYQYPAADHTVNAATHLDELRTFSAHRDMPDATRQSLYAAIQSAFHAHGDRLTYCASYLLLTTRPLPVG